MYLKPILLTVITVALFWLGFYVGFLLDIDAWYGIPYISTAVFAWIVILYFTVDEWANSL